MPFETVGIHNALMNSTSIYPNGHFCINIPNALLVGERAILDTASNQLITDSLHWNHSGKIFESEGRRNFEYTHLDYEDGKFKLKENIETVQHDEDVILLSGMEQYNYGAFLLRTLSKISTLNRLQLSSQKIFVSTSAKWQLTLASAFGIDIDRIIPYDRTKLHAFKNLIVPDMPTSELFCDDQTNDLYDQIVYNVRTQIDTTNRPEKLYISRRTQTKFRPNYRPLVNEDDLINLLESEGFYIFEPESVSFEEQVAMFSGAKFVIGPSGAGMFNTIFCPPETKILSMEPMETWATLHANLFSGRKHHYGMVLGGVDMTDMSSQKRWRTDPDLILSLYRQMK